MEDMPCGVGEIIKADNIKDQILNGELYGFVQCSMRVTDDYINHYLEYPPFFVTKEIGKQKKLTSYLECKDVLINTELFKWYMSQPGIECTNIIQAIKYNRHSLYKPFVSLCAEMRRDKSNPIAGDLYKLFMNSFFGKMGQNNANYTQTKIYNDEKKAKKKIELPTFRGIEDCSSKDKKMFVVSMDKKSVKHDMPVQGAACIYSNAKMIMLDFVYNFVNKYIPKECYQIMYMDTDSTWMAFSEPNPFGLPDKLAPTVEEANYPLNPGLCKPGLEDEFNRDKYKYLVMSEKDSKTPGPMKVEYEAEALVCLAAKSYFATPRYKTEINKKGKEVHPLFITDSMKS